MRLGERLPVQLVLGLVLCQCACAAKLAITSLEPSSVFLGPRRDLVIVGGEGRRGVRELVFAELSEQARRLGFFQVTDLSREGFQMRRDGGRVELEAFDRPLGDSEVGLWIDVEVAPETQPPAAGLTLSVAAFAPGGESLLRSHRVDGVSQDGLDGAAAVVAAELLRQITPAQVTRLVRLDEEDADQLPILQVALDGNIARAREDMKAYVANEPENAAAVYNLAVLTEAMGKLGDALVLYDRALNLVEKDLYSKAREAAARYANLEAAVTFER
jgi:hypothetical protein